MPRANFVNNPWPALIFGVALVSIGIGLLRWQIRSWRGRQNDANLDDHERTYYGRQFRRRVQISATFAILGVLIVAGDLLLPMQRQQPLLTTLYWIGVLLLTGWVMLLGMGDFWSTASHSRAELTRVRMKHRELERQVVEFKHRHLGHGGSRESDPTRN